MTIELDVEVYQRIQLFPWFAHCGEPGVVDMGVATQPILDIATAMSSLQSILWCDAKTHAQGELTAYLAGQDYAAYGEHWNTLAKQSEAFDESLAIQVTDALVTHGLEKDVAPLILVDVGRAALEISFRRKFRKAPVFFEQLLKVYEAGRLPCGWDGEIDDWPNGKLLVY